MLALFAYTSILDFPVMFFEHLIHTPGKREKAMGTKGGGISFHSEMEVVHLSRIDFCNLRFRYYNDNQFNYCIDTPADC